VACVAAALCAWVFVCMLLLDFGERQCAVVSVRSCVAVLLYRYVAVPLCCCVAVYGTSLHWTVAAAVSSSSRAAAAVVLSHDTSGCSCSVVASPPPSLACVWTPVMCAAVCLLYVSAVKHHCVAVLQMCHSQHSLAVCRCCVLVVAVRQALVRTFMASLCVAL
jgi:hypothetical protein